MFPRSFWILLVNNIHNSHTNIANLHLGIWRGKGTRIVFKNDVQSHTTNSQLKTLRTGLLEFYLCVPFLLRRSKRNARTQQICLKTFELENSCRFHPPAVASWTQWRLPPNWPTEGQLCNLLPSQMPRIPLSRSWGTSREWHIFFKQGSRTEVNIVLLAAKPVALCPANFLWVTFYFAPDLEIYFAFNSH